MRSGRKRAALRTARRRGKPHLREGVHSAGQVRDLAWTRPCDAVSRLTRATRRSPRSLTQHVSGLADADLTESNQAPQRFSCDRYGLLRKLFWRTRLPRSMTVNDADDIAAYLDTGRNG